MRTLDINKNNDIYTTNGSLTFVEGKEAVAKICTHVVRTQLGEVSYDNSRGVPYLETVLGDNPDVDLWASNMVRSLESVPYVKNVQSFNTQVNDDTLSYLAYINSIYGNTMVGG